MGQKLLSIIVPVYNAEKYIKECCASLTKQTYKNIEIIFVNDGSKDNSLTILEELAKNDDRIVLKNKPNGGAASARNLGVEAARGDYIGFCDADDYFDEEAFERLIKVLEDNNLATVECKARVFGANGNIVETEADDEVLKIKTLEEAIRDIYLRTGNVSLATRLTKKEFIKPIKIPEGKRVEDFYFTLCLLLNTNGTAVYNYPCYNCCLSDGSVTRSGGGSIYLDAIDFYNKSVELLKDFNFEEEQTYYLLKMYYLLFISANKDDYKNHKQEMAKCKKDLIKRFAQVKNNKYLKEKEKIMLLIAMLSTRLTHQLYLVKNRGEK